MIEMSQDEIERRIQVLEEDELPMAVEKYLKLQNQMVDRQGFVSMQLQTDVELAKNEYFKLKDDLDELKNLLSYLEEA
ncbi:MAG: hypothetical protein IIU46_09910 [Treponema sp.]|nr:hypothetical protein [Treponema sp.]